MPTLAHVALPLPLATPYTYSVPDTLADLIVPGARVVVPLRNKELVGIVTAVGVDRPLAEPKEILAAPDAEPALSPALLKTGEWIAGYYGSPIGLALKAMLPADLWGESEVMVRLIGAGDVGGGVAGRLVEWLSRRGGGAVPLAGAARALGTPLWSVAGRLARIGRVSLEIRPPRTERRGPVTRIVRLAGPPLPLLERDRIFARRVKQRALYETLEQSPDGIPTEQLRERLQLGAGVVKALVEQGLATVTAVGLHRDPFADDAGTAAPTELTRDQLAALDQLAVLPAGGAALLFGVTGSGKTLVYLEVIRRELAHGRGAIILVPEIGLTPQTVSRVRGLFGDRVAVLHSALSDGERADAWRSLREGKRLVAVGPRSAVFAPVRDLAYIVVDEEHEATYKNGETPRYHARDVARVRCRLEGARLLLGSATPSLETASEPAERLTVIRLPERIGSRPLPPVEIVDLRKAARIRGVGAVPWSETLDRLLGETLARREQSILLLNRRGYASFLQCTTCGAVRECSRCSISLTVHRSPALLKCHYCAYQEPYTETCAACGATLGKARGIGTQQVEQLVAERFPTARIARMDLDTTGTKWSHHAILDRVGRGDVDVLVGTQMIAKGIDFPNVTLVGVVDADTALHLPDFRSSERTFQLLTQVAGRAGRGPKGGRVVVQTWTPEHHGIGFARTHDTEGFWAAERIHRAAPAYPPFTSLVNLVLSGVEQTAVIDESERLARAVDRVVTRHTLDVQVLGPAPCPMARIKDRWRWHLVLKGSGEPLGRLVRYLAPKWKPPEEIRFAIDRDPVSML
ncbi:MAG: primosomal protein N' [Gemmatimonadota bacterium]